jgi:hypothetical protein
VTADEIWKLIEPYIKERLGYLKILIIAVTTIVGVFVSFFSWFAYHIFSDTDVRRQFVSHWIVNVPYEMKSTEGLEALDVYLNSTRAKNAVSGFFNDDFKAAMKKVVAYSYSAEFALGPGNKTWHKMPFYKTATDRGIITCQASYATDSETNARWPLSMQWNDAGDSNNFTFSDENKASSHITKKIPQNSKNLFGQDGVYSENQEVKITIPDKAPDGSTLQSPVEVRCTMLIVGLAPYMGDLE